MKDVRSAIKYCADNGSKDVEGLRQDIRNVPCHVFDEHSNCRDYFCVHKGETSDSPCIIEDLKRCGVWDKIIVVMEKLASKAEFLCENKTSNLYVASHLPFYAFHTKLGKQFCNFTITFFELLAELFYLKHFLKFNKPLHYYVLYFCKKKKQNKN